MTSKHDSRSRHGHDERKGMRQKIKGILGHRKNTTTPQVESQAVQSSQGSSNDLELLQPQGLEAPSENPPNHQGSTFVPDQDQRPPLTQHDHDSEVNTTGHAPKSEDLWKQAYDILELREPDLMGAYKLLLTPIRTNLTDPSLSPEMIETIVNSKLEDREANQLVINLGKKSVKVREQGEKVITFILWSKDIVSQALSAQPYAALAWSGVSMLLPLLLNSSQQSHAMIEGLSSVADLLRLYRIKEMFYLRDADNANKPVHLNFVQAVVDLYSNIFEYQARMICHLSQSSLKRGIRGTLELDDWGGMLKKIKTCSDTSDQYCVHLDRTRESEFFDNESTHMLQSLDIQTRILNTLETSQTSRQQDIRNEKEAELLEILASNYKSDKESVSVRIPGTCKWFYEDDRFLSWRDSKHSRLLWVSAGPGCGKSVLSRSLIDERRVTTNALNSTVCYFFFKDGQEQRMSGANAFSAILHQLFENTALISYALPSAKSYGKKLRDAFSELWGILMRCAQDSEAGDIICILDALDECEEKSRYQLIEKLVSFSKNEAQKSPCKLKFLVTSRPYEDLEWRFQEISTFSTYLRFDGDEKSRMIGEEINLVIDHEMPRIAKDFSVQHRERISTRLKEMDNRNYLWLFLTLGIITASRSKYSKMSSIDSLLSSLPSKVSDAYEEILSRSSNEATARVLLQLILAATRPLSLQEINIALALATQKTKCPSHEVLNEDLWPPQEFKSTVRNMCGLFVSVHDGIVSLIHQTAREFLIRRNKLPESWSGKWQGYIDMATAHGTMFQVCYDYLNLDALAGIFQTELSREYKLREYKTREYYIRRSNRYHLLNYAALNWPVHYTSQGEERAADSWKAARILCNISLPQGSCWFETYCHFHRRSIGSQTSLGIACFLGLRQVAERFIDEGDDVNAVAMEYSSTALQVAAAEGHVEVVEMLLDKGASMNTDDREGNALYEASFEAHHQVVQLLLDRGADINAHGGVFGNALQAALFQGSDRVVQLLLDRGADVNAQGGKYGNALQVASAYGHIKTVQILLDKGADINAQGGHFGSALQAASSSGSDQGVQILLDRGANVNARGGKYGNALQAASFSGSDQVVQSLLDRGADIDAQELDEALREARLWGHHQVVQILLAKRAKSEADNQWEDDAMDNEDDTSTASSWTE